MNIKQSFAKNDDYEILTPNGWENFDGVFCNYEPKTGATLFLKSGLSVTATDDHRFYSHGVEKMVKDFVVGDSIDTTEDNDIVVDIQKSSLNVSYDVFNAENHRILANSVIFSHQCDELAKISPNVQQEFWSSVRPTLSCIDGDTLVLTGNGFKKIEDFHKNREVGDYFSIDGLTVWGKEGLETVSHGYVSPESDTLKIVLESGHTVEATLNHPLYHLTPSGGAMKPSKDLVIGDYLRVDYGMNVFGPIVSNIEESYIDGCVASKHYNDKILQKNKNNQTMFLCGVFDTVGKITNKHYSIRSENKELISHIQLLLSNLGILSFIPHSDSNTLTVPYTQFKLFSKEIGSKKDRVTLKLQKYSCMFENCSCTIPLSVVRPTLNAIMRSSDRLKTLYCDCLKNKRHVSPQWLKQFANNVKMVDNDLYQQYELFFKEFIRNSSWYKIVSITPSKNKTYDFTVPNTHSFLQNGIIGSNTGGRCIITSTPDNDTDLFSQLWKGAENTTDEYGNTTEVGTNGFVAIKAKWSDCPDRSDDWAIQERKAIGEDLFLRDHECEFISMESTLINAMVLARLSHKEPLYTMGSVRWFKEIDPNSTYIVSLDPSSGVGKDYAAIQIVEMPQMVQVGEWMHNRTPPKGQITVLLSILKFLASKMNRSDPDIYWSFENNSVGEGILQLILEMGEEKFPGVLVNEPKGFGMIKKSRRGLHTTNKVKLLACSKLKSFVESDKLSIHSQAFLFQLKNFVATGMSFAGKPGVNDDLISSMLIAIRIMLIVAQWGAYDESSVREIEEDEELPPMPIVYSNSFY